MHLFVKKMPFARVFIILALAMEIGAKEVCYEEVGCFNNDPPYDLQSAGFLPQPPSQLPLDVLLYTRQQSNTSVAVQYNDPDLMTTLKNAHFDSNKDTKCIIHGWREHLRRVWIPKMKDALLEKGDFNVILIGWEKAAEMINYFQAIANMRVVGAQIQILLETLREGGVDMAKVHLIGHSLGSHLTGEVGRRMNGSIGRITALDAAGPQFEGTTPELRLDETDAMFVDAIHTNGQLLGIKQPVGHVDFYPNGGLAQPGCVDYIPQILGKRSDDVLQNILDITVGCSHIRSHELFTESINSDCAFTAYPCSSYGSFKRGQCGDCSNNGCNEMGFHADPSKGKGSLYLQTHSGSPFCDDEPPSSSWFWKELLG